jgi:hypothetical protein
VAARAERYPVEVDRCGVRLCHSDLESRRAWESRHRDAHGARVRITRSGEGRGRGRQT